MNKEQAYDRFWNSFEWDAYDENSVPEKAELPYITYQMVTSDFDSLVTATASLWDRSYSWKSVTEKAEEIASEISRGGKLVKYDGGAFWIRKSSTWTQRMTDSDTSVRRIILTVTIEYID